MFPNPFYPSRRVKLIKKLYRKVIDGETPSDKNILTQYQPYTEEIEATRFQPQTRRDTELEPPPPYERSWSN